MKTRLVVVLALVSVLVVGIVPFASAQDTVTVEVYFPIAVDSPVTNILAEYEATYEEMHPNVDIVWSFEGGYGDVKNKLLTTMEGGGDLPALAIMLATDIYDLRNADVIMPFDAYVDEAYLGDFFPNWLANSYYDGDFDGTPELYGLPFQRSTVLLYVNKTLVEEAGFAMPTTRDELAEIAQALTTDDRWGILIPNSWPYWLFQPFTIGAGQNIVDESDVDVYFDNPVVIDALQFWVDLYEVYGATPAGVQSNWGDAPGLFTDGAAVMIAHSTGSLPGILGKADFEVGVSAIPGTEGFATVTGGGNLYLVEGTDETTADAAWGFVEWLTSPEMAVDWSIKTGYITTRVSGLELDAWVEYTTANPQAADTVASLEFAGREFSVQSLGEVRNVLHGYILQVLNDEMSPADAMAAAQADADEILSIFK